ncbi:DUF3696 domain-containing protein [Dactylosporangium aurantiacum]|uniref:DUF3696 domain-containing protein n=1 Tax=Dactylosporangium aurantiacum TaxID=35754 RepID=A0A9Q9MEP7_9ACTN|nr:DUF3696 domain-containing protein [Dactylosporangium aurantiacum]MDG6105163.1 DUF3696 domain-containing protein [Dactylosporangium aurantiacum]UWZ51685.1 DUF3696 domain-containing protein [Dactylosporangium aurantiacum]
MTFVRMALTGYRSFADRQEIELRPITIVLGRNNSGKSALVRAPLVINSGIATNSTAPLDLDRFGDDTLDSFTDLIYGGRPHGSIRIELDLLSVGAGQVEPTLHVDATVQNIDEYRLQLVSDTTIRVGHQTARFTWDGVDPQPERQRYLISRDGAAPVAGAVRFAGLLPNAVQFRDPDASTWSPRRFASSAIRAAFDEIRYLGPFRDRPARGYRLPTRRHRTVGFSGEHTAPILASDFVRNQGRLLRQVNRMFEQSLEGWEVDVVERGALFTMILRSRNARNLQVNLADTGTGVAQALPILVQRAMDVLNPPSGPTLEIVEQPELHLHPAAHADLADLYLQAATQTSVRFLIETHSETMLLRLRRRIAERVIPADLVAVYFVDQVDGTSHAHRIFIDDKGNVDYWPAGIFAEDYEETRKLAEAQLDRLERGDAD